MPHMITYGGRPEVDRKCHPSFRPSVILSVCPFRNELEVSVCPKHFPYLLDEPYARELQAQGAAIFLYLQYLAEFTVLIYTLVHWSSLEKTCPF